MLRRISDLLYNQRYTIKGVQRLLREGGGKLSDNIPPPTAEERAAVEAEMAEAEQEMLIPGLDLPPTPPQAPVRPPPRQKTDPEVERLRAALRETLQELEWLRSLLP